MQAADNDLYGKAPVDSFFSKTPLSPQEFSQISEIVYEQSGIRLNIGKEELVRSRLMKRLRTLGIATFREYLKHVLDDRSDQELKLMIDFLTTNKTSFFREKQHFDYLRAKMLPVFKNRNDGLRIWSAGCSSGEEPFSIAMLISEELPGANHSDIKILATDISFRILQKARAGEYDADTVQEIPTSLLAKYFTLIKSDPPKTYRVNDSIGRMVRFARLNLMESWPMKGLFDVIFCRNVMIYFDNDSQRKLVHRFSQMLVPGGHLFVGHSESLVASSSDFKYVQPATYVKI
jgi:chemotaxis protein methyltransferase CheR